MNIFTELKKDINEVGKSLCVKQEALENITIEVLKDYINGDLSTNIAMIIASKEGKNPREIALKFKASLINRYYIHNIEVANPGFINFTIKLEFWVNCITQILNEDTDFKKVNIGKNQTVNIEYVSANVTGPMHIGHARCAIYGDALASLLIFGGYKVTKEYYVNDAGSQINTLVNTVIIRYMEIINGEKIEIPEGLYPGEYLINTAKKLFKMFGNKLVKMQENIRYKLVKRITINEMMKLIKKDLKSLGVKHDIFFSEQYLHDKGKINDVIKELKRMNLIYEGTLNSPKNADFQDLKKRAQLLFKSRDFGDDQDRSIQKEDGTWSYFAADIAYVQDKINRGFKNLIYIFGADHSGYVKRITAVVKALSKERVTCEVKICQTVSLIEDGLVIKMSKRTGSFVTVEEVINAVGKNIIRFIMLTKKNDAHINFDLSKIKEQSKDNPVFYVQYAYVRTISILKHAEKLASNIQDIIEKSDLSLLSLYEEINLIKLLASWPKVLESAVIHFEPHRIAFYLLNLAAKFHSLWNLGKLHNDYRFIIQEDLKLTYARLSLVLSVQKIINYGFEAIGVTPVQKM